MRRIHRHVAEAPRERRDSVPDVSLAGAAAGLRNYGTGSPQPFEQRAFEEIED